MTLTKAEVEHLRRLLGWMRCSEGVFQSPEEIRATWKDLNAHGIIPGDNAETRERLMQSYNLSADVPKYIRHGLKMLTETLREHDRKMASGATLNAELGEAMERVNEAAVALIESLPPKLS